MLQIWWLPRKRLRKVGISILLPTSNASMPLIFPDATWVCYDQVKFAQPAQEICTVAY